MTPSRNFEWALAISPQHRSRPGGCQSSPPASGAPLSQRQDRARLRPHAQRRQGHALPEVMCFRHLVHLPEEVLIRTSSLDPPLFSHGVQATQGIRDATSAFVGVCCRSTSTQGIPSIHHALLRDAADQGRRQRFVGLGFAGPVLHCRRQVLQLLRQLGRPFLPVLHERRGLPGYFTRELCAKGGQTKIDMSCVHASLQLPC